MALYKIGITEAGDAGIDLSWQDEMSSVDAAVLITKYISPEFIDAVLKFRQKLIIHATVTGYGNTVLEPGVPCPGDEMANVTNLLKSGFPMEQIVIRVDPIIPTDKGVLTAYKTITSFMEIGFSRYRISVIDMYPHVRERFELSGLPLPYGDSGFASSRAQLLMVDSILAQAKSFWAGLNNGKQLRIESCAETGLKEPIACGCISNYDLALLHFQKDTEASMAGYQRRNCMCYAGKTELLNRKTRCPHGCLYCYWKDNKR